MLTAPWDGIKTMSFCLQNKCAHCCIETDVPLLEQDINRILSLGYYDVYFVAQDGGVKFMRKLDGKCIFFKQGQCEIYDRRPTRCRLLPITYDGEKNCPAVQEDCRYKEMYEITLSGNKEMVDYVNTLRHECTLRSNHGNGRKIQQ